MGVVADEYVIKDNLVKAGLDWNVRSEGVQTISGLVIPKRVALIREDTNDVLGLHTDGYCPFQNHELLELLYRISDRTGLSYKKGGYFGNGEKVYFQLESDSLRLNGDKIEGSITGINSFDGRTSLAFGNSNKTISCLNTFFLVYKELDTKLRHSASMRPRLEEILRQIDVLLEEEKKTFRTIERMADVKITMEVKSLVTKMLFDLDKEERLDEKMSTYKSNKLIKFENDFQTEIKDKKDSLWGLFSSVTRYTTHSMKKGDNTENKIFGLAGKKEREIWSTLEEMVF